MRASGLEDKVNENGIATSFNIGYGFSDDFMLYYSNNVNWYNKDESGEPITYVNVISGIGITYCLDSEVYLNFVYGIATDYPYVDSWYSLDGTGYEIGVGYDIAKHVSVELDYSHSDYNKVTLGGTSINLDGVSATTHSLRMMIKYNWY